MPSYRFCRTDDVPLLADAYNRCFRVHFPDQPELTKETFKLWTRELDLWASSCMVAVEGGEPTAVLLGAKRDHASLLLALGVHPDHQRRGHGEHLVTSLGQKMAILEPTVLRAEVPAGNLPARRLLEQCGYLVRRELVDFRREGEHTDKTNVGPLFEPITLRDLPADLLEGDRCWQRSVESLKALQGSIGGWALLGDARFEGFVLYRPTGGETDSIEIQMLWAAEPEHLESIGGLLLRHLEESGRRLFMRRVSPREIPASMFESWGFERGATTIEYEIDVAP